VIVILATIVIVNCTDGMYVYVYIYVRMYVCMYVCSKYVCRLTRVCVEFYLFIEPQYHMSTAFSIYNCFILALTHILKLGKKSFGVQKKRAFRSKGVSE